MASLVPAPTALDLYELEGLDVGHGREEFSIRRRTGPWRDALRRRMLAVGDAAAVCFVGSAHAFVIQRSLLWVIAFLPVWLLLAKLYGLYDRDHRALRHLTVDEIPTIAAWVATGTATLMLVPAIVERAEVSPGAGIALWAALLVTIPAMRAFVRFLWRWIVPPERALIVGSGQLELAARRKLELFDDIHVECVGTIDDTEDPQLETQIHERRPIDRIIVASPRVTELLIARHVLVCRRHAIKLSVVPPARGMFGTAVQLSHVADLPMIEYSTWDTGRSTLALKRAIDVSVAGVALLMFSPLFVVIAAAIKLSSRGSVLFVQERAGLGGRPFRMLKFRTMVTGAETRLSDVVDLEALSEPVFKLQRDPRVTFVGRMLRRLSLDELPQLVNVLRGDMSLVGPRPEQLALVERYRPEHRFRLRVKPGLTGPMQVFGRGDLRFDERLAVEREYVENLSLRRDLRLLSLTFAAVVRGRGAY